jgi:hypothetical protein
MSIGHAAEFDSALFFSQSFRSLTHFYSKKKVSAVLEIMQDVSYACIIEFPLQNMV